MARAINSITLSTQCFNAQSANVMVGECGGQVCRFLAFYQGDCILVGLKISLYRFVSLFRCFGESCSELRIFHILGLYGPLYPACPT
jgi:hypothetical protein